MDNVMEMAVGLAYACHTNFVHLPDNHRIEFPNGKQTEGATQWADMWLLFEHLGISAAPSPQAADGPAAGVQPGSSQETRAALELVRLECAAKLRRERRGVGG